MPLNLNTVRASFPALTGSATSKNFIYADNAGGSQTLGAVITRITDYLSNTNCQLGADYSVSQTSTRRVDAAAEAAAILFGAEGGRDEIAFGPSSTMLCENLARAMEVDVKAGDEIIITGEHEANVGPWKRMAARRGAVLKVWKPSQLPSFVAGPKANPYAVAYDANALLSLLSSRTRLLAISACSNLLGSAMPVQSIVAAARNRAQELGARKLEVCVDCVAYAPHRLIDVKAWDVDYAVFSFYKVYAAHNAALYIRKRALADSLSSLAHGFLTQSVAEKPYKLQPGGPGYESVWAAGAVVPYLRSLARGDGASSPGLTAANSDDPDTVRATAEEARQELKVAFDAIAEHEQTLLDVLLGFLTADEQYKRGVRVVGDPRADTSPEVGRVPTISFVVIAEGEGGKAMKSKDVVAVFDKTNEIGIRYGHFYAYDLVTGLQPSINTDDAIVRISFVHYNTVEEARKVVDVLKTALYES